METSMGKPWKHDENLAELLLWTDLSGNLTWFFQLSNEKNPAWLFGVYRGWKTAQLCGDYKKSLQGSRIPIKQPV